MSLCPPFCYRPSTDEQWAGATQLHSLHIQVVALSDPDENPNRFLLIARSPPQAPASLVRGRGNPHRLCSCVALGMAGQPDHCPGSWRYRLLANKNDSAPSDRESNVCGVARSLAFAFRKGCFEDSRPAFAGSEMRDL